MERSYQTYQSLRGTNIMFGGTGGSRADEDHRTRHILCIQVRPCSNPYVEDQQSEQMEVQLALTTRQLAQIVWSFFGDTVFGPGTIFHTFLQRLITKRWALMTHPSFKDARNATWDSEFPDLQYHRDPWAVRPRDQVA